MSDCVIGSGSTRQWYIKIYGPLPDDILVCHTCDNPPCKNIDHIFLGNNSDNQIDARNKKRNPGSTGKTWNRKPESEEEKNYRYTTQEENYKRPVILYVNGRKVREIKKGDEELKGKSPGNTNPMSQETKDKISETLIARGWALRVRNQQSKTQKGRTNDN